MPAPTSSPSSFSLLVLGASGGPCETSCSGYLLKPYANGWEDGFVSIEGGSGVGALKVLMEEEEREREIKGLRAELRRLGRESSDASGRTSASGIADMVNGIDWPAGYDTPTLRAGYIFSFLTSYIITHGHLDHIASMVQSTGTLSSRVVPFPLSVSSPQSVPKSSLHLRRVPHPEPTRRSIYAARNVLQEVETAYRGMIWPELSVWAEERKLDDGEDSQSEAELVGARDGIGGVSTAHDMGTSTDGNPAPASSSSTSTAIGSSSTQLPIPSISSAAPLPASHPTKPRRKQSFISLSRKLFRSPQQSREGQGHRGKYGDVVRASEDGSEVAGEQSSGGSNGDATNHLLKGDSSLTNGDNRLVGDSRLRIRPRDPWWIKDGVGVQLCPLPTGGQYQTLPQAASHRPDASPLHPRPPHSISIMHMPVAHGVNSKGTFESSAFFIRLDEDHELRTLTGRDRGMEFLFWGDVESRSGAGSGEDYNMDVWREAARRWEEGRLGAVFIECSYDGERVATQMYGHLQPILLHNELRTMESFVTNRIEAGPNSSPPLQGLKVYVIHVKETFVPDDKGRTVRERVVDELRDIERARKAIGTQLGVEFVAAERGMTITI